MKCPKCGRWVYLGPPYHKCTVEDPEKEIREKFDEIVDGLNL